MPETAHPTGTFATHREDRWWHYPASILFILSGFVFYATFRILEAQFLGAQFIIDGGSSAVVAATGSAAGYHYLSPFGTPDLTFLVPPFLLSIPFFGQFLANPAAVILPFPAGFRFTCYYYRKAYYRAFVARPAACGTEAWKGREYQGEKRLMIFQNIHRYFLYAALVITVFLAYDAARSIYTPHGWYLGIGSVIMVVNVALLTGYTLGCHSLRHLTGGRLDCYSCDAVSMSQHGIWSGLSKLNTKHGFWAMASLFSVALTDLYIRWVGAHPGITHVLGVPV